MRSIGHTLLILRWEDPVPLRRAWCVFEMGISVQVGAAIDVIMPPSDVSAFRGALIDRFGELVGKTCVVDVESAGAREPADLANIQRMIRDACGGYLLVNKIVIGAMRDWMAREGTAALASLSDAGASARRNSPLILNLGQLHMQQGNDAKAEPLYREGLAHRRIHAGPMHPETLGALYNLSIVCARLGRLDDAEAFSRESLEGRRAVLGPTHEDTLESLVNHALLLQRRGKALPALAILREALAAQVATLPGGADSSQALSSAINIGSVLLEVGNCEEARRVSEEALAGFERTRAGSTPGALAARNNLSNALMRLGRLGEAEAPARAALEGYRRTMGDDHPNTLYAITNLGTLFDQQGRLPDAAELFAEALARRLAKLGTSHPETCMSFANLARVRHRIGDLGAAEENFRAALLGRQQSLGACHAATLQSVSQLVHFLQSRPRGPLHGDDASDGRAAESDMLEPLRLCRESFLACETSSSCDESEGARLSAAIFWAETLEIATEASAMPTTSTPLTTHSAAHLSSSGEGTFPWRDHLAALLAATLSICRKHRAAVADASQEGNARLSAMAGFLTMRVLALLRLAATPDAAAERGELFAAAASFKVLLHPHELARAPTPREAQGGRRYCDACYRVIPNDVACFSCAPCGYDRCLLCQAFAAEVSTR